MNRRWFAVRTGPPGRGGCVGVLAALCVVTASVTMVAPGVREVARAADPVACASTSRTIVNQRSSGTDVQNMDNTLEFFDLQTESVVTPPIVDLNDLVAPNRPNGIDEELNGLGISADGRYAYFTSHYLTGHANAPTGGSQIYGYDLVNETIRTWPTPLRGSADDNLRVRRGAVDPASGVYYYSTANENGTVQYLYGIDPDATTPTAWYVGAITTPNQVGVSGDFAFDSTGQMYIVTGSSSAAYVNTVDGVLPTSAAQSPVQLGVRNISTVSGTGNGVGITFGFDEYMYITNTTGQWFQVDPSTSQVIDQVGDIGGSGATVDIATCVYPSSLTVIKDIGSKPYASDQFTITAVRDSDGALIGDETTTGTVGARRATIGPVPILTDAGMSYTIGEVLAAGSTSTSLADYVTHLTCVDEADPTADPLFDDDLDGTSNRGASIPATGPTGGASYQHIVCTLTNRDARPARLVLDKLTDEPTDETFAIHYPDVGGAPDGDGNWPGAPRAADTDFAPGTPIGGTTGLSFQPYRCTETSKHVFAGCVVEDIGAAPGSLDIDLDSLGDDPAGVLQFQEQFTDEQIAAGWRRVGPPDCTADNTNPNLEQVDLDAIDPSDGATWSAATGGLARYQIAVGSIQPGTVLTCNIRNAQTPATWTTSKASNPVAGTPDDPTVVFPGDTITYSVRLENPVDESGADLRNVVITDDLSDVLGPGVALVPGSIEVLINGEPGPLDDPSRSLVELDGPTLTWSTDFVEQGDIWDLRYTVQIAADQPFDTYGLQIHNRLWAEGATSTTDGCTIEAPCSTYHQTPAPDWTVTKATSTGELQPDGSYTTTPGYPIVYSITVDNTDGLVPLYGVTIDDGPVDGDPQDIWDVATWDGTFTVQTVNDLRFTQPVPSATLVDPTPANGLQYTFPDPIPAGERAVITFTLQLADDAYQTVAQNVVQAGIRDTATDTDLPALGPRDCAFPDPDADPPQTTDTNPPCAVVHRTAPGTLTLEKVTEPAGFEDLFVLSADSGIAPPAIDGLPGAFEGIAGTPEVTSQPVYPGVRYTISEVLANGGNPDNWTNGLWTCQIAGADPEEETGVSPALFDEGLLRFDENATTTVLVQSAQDVICSITNVGAAPTLALAKQVEHANGGDADPTAWTLVANDGDDDVIDGPGTTVSATLARTDPVAVVAGTSYILSEAGGPTGYAPADPAWACVDASAPAADVDLTGAIVTPVPGQTLVCTVTNASQPGIVTVTKYGPDGATPLAGATFSLWLDDGDGTFDPGTDTLVSSGSTPADGTYRWTGLLWGTYFVEETAAPVGHDIADPAVHTLTVDGTSTTGDGATTAFTDPVATPAWTLRKTADPASGVQVDPGDTVTYTLTAINTSNALVVGATATDDLSEVLQDADLSAPLDSQLSLVDTTLTWTLPAPLGPDDTVTVSYAVVVHDDAVGVDFTNAVTPGEGGTCDGCTTDHSTADAYGSLQVVKAVATGSAPWLATRTYTGTYTCTRDGASVAAGTWSIAGTGTATFTEIEAPSTCTVTEGALPAVPDGSWTWATPALSPAGGVVAVTPGGTATVTVTNSASSSPTTTVTTTTPTSSSPPPAGSTLPPLTTTPAPTVAPPPPPSTPLTTPPTSADLPATGGAPLGTSRLALLALLAGAVASVAAGRRRRV